MVVGHSTLHIITTELLFFAHKNQPPPGTEWLISLKHLQACKTFFFTILECGQKLKDFWNNNEVYNVSVSWHSPSLAKAERELKLSE